MSYQDGATWALRGYRLQALYTLSRLLDQEKAVGEIFQPEGKEDLHILDEDGQILEVVQVKALSTPLRASDLQSFFVRMIDLRRQAPDATITIASFGEIGPELAEAAAGADVRQQQLAAKVAKFASTDLDEALDLITSIQIADVKEEDITTFVDEQLESALTGIDPESAFSLLHHWLYHCAEKKVQIHPANLVTKVNAVGEFIRQRAAYHSTWFTAIVPLEDSSISEEQQKELIEQFYHGNAARYEHILANVDAARPELIEQLDTQFREAAVVIVHGASGQGKSTLAYRYLYDYFPGYWRFQVYDLHDIERAQEVALALSAHAQAIAVPMAVYIDVKPVDVGWQTVVTRLASVPGVHLLVTLREEDWQRDRLEGYEFNWRELEMKFSEEEARKIYTSLEKTRASVTTVSFEDAWNRFGKEDALLEFVYLVTQGANLRERLRGQVKRLMEDVRKGTLKEAELELLRLTSVANAFEARVKTAKIARQLGLPVAQQTLQYFEQEYLLRVDDKGESISSLHPIRSQILSDLLTDPTLAPWSESAARCIELIDENDLANFLLYAFSRRDSEAQSLLDVLNRISPQTWRGAHGILRALLWLGVARYVNEITSVSDVAIKEFGDSFLVLDFDIADASPGLVDELRDMLLKNVSPDNEKLKKLQSIREQQPDKQKVFDYAKQWVTSSDVALPAPQDMWEWEMFADAALWIGRIKPHSELVGNITAEVVSKWIDRLPIDTLARIALALHYCNTDQYMVLHDSYGANLRQRFRSEMNGLWVSDVGSTITCHFLVPYEDLSGKSGQKQKKGTDTLNEEAMRRVSLLRMLFPDREKYVTFGYGHKIGEIGLEYDSTHKEIAIKDQPLPAFVAMDRQFLELLERRARISTWDEFAATLMDLRWHIVRALCQIETALQSYFRRNNIVNLFQGHVDSELLSKLHKLLTSPPALPQAAGDEWGFVRLTDRAIMDEVSAIQSSTFSPNLGSIPSSTVGAYRSALIYLPFVDPYKDYVQAWNTFFLQVGAVLAINPRLGREVRSEKDRLRLEQKAKDLGLDINAPRVTIAQLRDALKFLVPFQNEFRKLLQRHVDRPTLDQLEQDEQLIINRFWPLWYLFSFHPQHLADGAKIAAEWVRKVEDGTVRLLEGALRKITRETINIRIVTDGPSWEGAPVLWVAVDVYEEASEFGVFAAVFSCLRSIQNSLGPQLLRYYVYENLWPYVGVVPLLYGKSMRGRAWIYPLHSIALDGENAELSKWSSFSKNLDLEIMNRLGVSLWEDDVLADGEQMLAASSALYCFIGHLRHIFQLEEGDGLTELILGDYLNEKKCFLEGEIVRFKNALAGLVKIVQSLSRDELLKRSKVAQAFIKASSLSDHIWPEQMRSEEVTRFSKESLDEWMQNLTKAVEEAREIRDLCFRDLIERQLG